MDTFIFSDELFKIKYSKGWFTLFRGIDDGQPQKHGWEYWFDTGMPTSYRTRSLSVVRKCVDRGWAINADALKELERMEKCKQ